MLFGSIQDSWTFDDEFSRDSQPTDPSMASQNPVAPLFKRLTSVRSVVKGYGGLAGELREGDDPTPSGPPAERNFLVFEA